MRRPAIAALALAAGAALLQACAAPQPSREDGVAGPTRPDPGSAAQAARQPSPQPSSSQPSPGPARPEPAFVPASAALPSVRRGAALPGAWAGRSPRAARDLAGLTDGQLLSVMGEPDLRRREDTAEVWLYRSPACLLDVFLEAERPEAEPRVVLATARPVGAAAIAEEACLRALARARAGLRRPFQP